MKRRGTALSLQKGLRVADESAPLSLPGCCSQQKTGRRRLLRQLAHFFSKIHLRVFSRGPAEPFSGPLGQLSLLWRDVLSRYARICQAQYKLWVLDV